MPNLSIKNVPDDVVEKLRERAAHNHRSLQGELMAMVCAAVADNKCATESERVETGWKSVDQVLADRKSERTRPITKAPSAVDIIRRERDAR